MNKFFEIISKDKEKVSLRMSYKDNVIIKDIVALEDSDVERFRAFTRSYKEFCDDIDKKTEN